MDSVVPGWISRLRGSRGPLAAGLLALAGAMAPGAARAELFVSSIDTDEVLRYGDDGAFLGVFASGGGLIRPRGLTFGLDGHLYVVSSGVMDSKVLRYEGTTGAFLGTFVAAGSGGLDLPRGITFGPDGHLYAADEDNNAVLRFHGSTGASLGTFTPTGDANTDTQGGRGLAFGPDGHLYVPAFVANSVRRYDGGTGAFIDEFVPNDAGTGRPGSPFSLTFGPDGRLYVSAEDGNEVLRYQGPAGAAPGQLVDVFVPDGGGGLAIPRDLRFGLNGRLYVVSRDNDADADEVTGRVQVYDGATGASLGVFVAEESGGLDFPSYLTFRRPPPRILCVRPGGTAPDFASIQAALAAAGLGDVIRVAAGTYAENLVVAKTVTLEGGWDDTCTQRDPAAFVSTIRPATTTPGFEVSVVRVSARVPVLDGFTITAGRADLGGQHGGGLLLRDSDAVVRNNVITGNKGFLFGGGVWVQRGAPRFEGNRITENEATDALFEGQGGGGIHLENTHATLVGNVIEGNFTGRDGGGVLVAGGGPVLLEGNLVRRNRAGTGGGILALGVTEVNGERGLTIRGGELVGNVAGAEPDCLAPAGGLRATHSEVVLDGVVVRDNCSFNGTLEFGDSVFTIRNSIVADNRNNGGILVYDAGSGTVVNSTLRGNPIGLFVSDGVPVALTNSIVAAHTQAGLYVSPPDHVTVAFSVFFANATDAVNTVISSAAGNLLGVDPLLGPDLAPRPGSPVIDTGTNAGCPGADLRGTPRPRDGDGDGVAVCDRGAFEGPTVAGVLDLDGDRRADVGVFHTRLGEWRLVGSTGGPSTVVFGQAGDWPVPGDYDGDGRVDLAVYRPGPGQFLIQGTTAGLVIVTPGSPGNPGGIPVPADYDGDGRTDPAVYHPALGLWEVLRSAAGPLASVLGGLSGDVPAPADYDGDGKADRAVFRAATGEWRIAGSAAGDLTVVLGGAGPGLVPVPADYDGDGRADPALFQPAGARAAGQALWRLLRSTAGLLEVPFGEVKAGVTPVPADYDGDGLSDVAVFERTTGEWQVLGSTAGPLTLTTGPPRRGEVPIGLRLPGR